MTGFNAQPTDGNNIIMSSAVSPGDKTPRVIRGGPENVDGQGNTLVDVAMMEYDSIGTSTNITAATTFSGVPTISQLAANSYVMLANQGGQATGLAQISIASAFNGTLSFYGLEPDGSTLQLINAHQRNSTTIATSTAINTGAALNQVWVGNIAAFKALYVVCTTYTSGTAAVTLALSAAPYAVEVLNSITASSASVGTTGSAVPASADYIGGNKGGNLTGLTLDGSGNLNVNLAAGGGSGGTALADDAAFTVATTSFTPVGGLYNDSAAAATSGHADVARLSQNRGLHVNIRNNAGTELATSSNPLQVSLANTAANSTAVKVDNSGVTQPVSGTVSITANSSVNVNQVGGNAVVTGGANGLLAVGGPVASGSANADNPVKVGGAYNSTQPTVTTGQIVDAQMTSRGAQIVATGTDTFNVTVNAALPAGGNTVGAVTQASGPWTQNVTQFGGSNVVTGTGAGGSGIPRVTVSNDTQLQLWDGTNGPVAAKAARTSPTLADISHVHSISPNNTGLPVNLPVIVQSHAAKSTGSVASLGNAFSSNNVAGNSIIVVCGVGNGTAPTISDTNSNTYTQAAQINNSTALNVAVFFAVNIAAGANTVTVNNGGSTASIASEIYEVSGLLALIPAQPGKTATNTGSSGTASTSSISIDTPNQYAFAAIGVGTAAQTITVGSGWTNDSGQQNPTTPAGLFSFVAMSQLPGGIKAVTPSATFTSEPWAIAVATFKPVSLGVEGKIKITDGTTTMAFGSQTSANSMPVVIASDQGNVATNVAQFGGSNVVTGTGAGGSGIPRVTISNDSSLAANQSVNLNQVAGNGIAVGNNAVPILNSAATGYVSAYGSNPATTGTASDATFKWGAGGTTQVNHVMIQNNATINVNWDLDTATTVGSPLLAPGQTVFLDVQTTAVHLQSASSLNINGSSAGNVVVRGWL